MDALLSTLLIGLLLCFMITYKLSFIMNTVHILHLPNTLDKITLSPSLLISPCPFIVVFTKCHQLPPFKGRVVKKINVFKELAPRLRTYELRGQGKKYKKEIASTNPRQTNTSRCPTKTTSENDHQSLK